MKAIEFLNKSKSCSNQFLTIVAKRIRTSGADMTRMVGRKNGHHVCIPGLYKATA